jgi:hypothetical protein
MSLTPSGFAASITNNTTRTPLGVAPVSSSTTGTVPAEFSGQLDPDQLAQYKELYLQQQSQRLSDLAVEVNNFSGNTPRPARQRGITTSMDWRARLRPKNGGKDLFWKGGREQTDYLLRPLQASNGLVWQYTPTILLSGVNNYNKQEFQGSNYPLVTYKNSTPPDITIVQDFTANSIDEARYMLGVMHFCRVATKSFFGDTAVMNGLYGTPPPVFVFEYLGHHGFNKVPVVFGSYNINLPDDVDYVPVKTGVEGDETTFVPVSMNLSVTLMPSYTPHKLRRKFDLTAFTTGAQYKDGFI